MAKIAGVLLLAFAPQTWADSTTSTYTQIQNPSPMTSPTPSTAPAYFYFMNKDHPAPPPAPSPNQIGSTDTTAAVTEPRELPGTWGSWSHCDAACDGGLQFRDCEIGVDVVADSNCEGGEASSKQPCNVQACSTTTTTTTTTTAPTTTTTTVTTTSTTVKTRPSLHTTSEPLEGCVSHCGPTPCAEMLDSRTCLQIVDDGCFCESCFTYNDNDPQYTAIDKCSYTTCGAAQKLAQPCTSANPCSMTDCAAFCTANVEFDDGVVECSHFFSMISGGCILYYGCDSDRTTGETGSTYAKNWEETTNPMNAPDKPTTTPDPSESCEGRCGGGDDERDHLDWCSCSPTCDDYVNAQECCDDYEEMCPITLPPTTTTPDPYPGNWNDWGDCSVTCGTGKKFRTCDTGIEQQCLGDAASTCHAGACPVETASTTTDAAPKNSCVARCGDDPSDDSNVDDCICTDVCQQTFVPNECCNDYYARCVGDHQNGGDLIDPNEGIESNVSPYPDQGLERGTTDEPEESEDNTAFYIIGGVLGGVVVLILIVLIVRCCAAKRAKDKHVVAGGLSGHAVTYPNVEMQHVSSRPSDRHDFMTI